MFDTEEFKKLNRIPWNNITKEELIDLAYKQGMSDALIANLYGVEKDEVTCKRFKWGIKLCICPELKKFVAKKLDNEKVGG